MASILVHIVSGPEHPTRAALGLLVAKTALADGHQATVFFDGDGVQVIRNETLDAIQGVGTGSAREHFDDFVAAGGLFYLSKTSCDARGVYEDDFGQGGEMASPEALVRFITEFDRAVTY